MKHIFLIMMLAASLPIYSQTDTSRVYTTNEFLSSMGVCVHIQHGQDPEKVADVINYIGIKNVRDGADKNYSVEGLAVLCEKTNSKVVIGPGSGAVEEDIENVIKMAKYFHKHKMLLAIEGPNEPNNFGGLRYNGEKGGGEDSWLPVALFQKQFYSDIKKDKDLKNYPVFGISETGAMTDNVGLQYLKVPDNSVHSIPEGTVFADYVNCHNYMYHPSWKGIHPNQVWNAASPYDDCRVDGLYGNHCRTWRNKFKGYEHSELRYLPKVTTETGVRVGDEDGAITEHIQGCNYMNVFLSQFKRGWRHTFIYEVIDDGDGAFGFFTSDCKTKRLSADYMHNFTSILRNGYKNKSRKGVIRYSLAGNSEEIHDIILTNGKNGCFIIVWGEKIAGNENVSVKLDERVAKLCVFDPTVGMKTINQYNNVDNINISVSDHPIILQIEK